jgi:hypothetical protein
MLETHCNSYLNWKWIPALLLLIACDNPIYPPPPKSTFDSPFPKRNRDLTNILGNQLRLKIGNDTIVLNISCNSKGNLLTNNRTKDTLFYGTVCKFRGLYYFNERQNDTSYWIYAVKIRDNLIYGFNTALEQTYSIDKAIEAGKNKKLVRYIDTTKARIGLHPDRKELKRLFTGIIDKIRPDTILKTKELLVPQKDYSSLSTEIDPDDFDYLSKVYPNPTKGEVNIELQEKKNISYLLSDISGNIIQQGQFESLVNKIDLGNQANGFCFLTLITPTDKQKECFTIIKTE